MRACGALIAITAMAMAGASCKFYVSTKRTFLRYHRARSSHIQLRLNRFTVTIAEAYTFYLLIALSSTSASPIFTRRFASHPCFLTSSQPLSPRFQPLFHQLPLVVQRLRGARSSGGGGQASAGGERRVGELQCAGRGAVERVGPPPPHHRRDDIFGTIERDRHGRRHQRQERHHLHFGNHHPREDQLDDQQQRGRRADFRPVVQ